uniref:Uncharacterized protein n=1 Tax=Anguilla anguilla TaxID=7936 RepID=A0A0E9R3C0_ANGAN
MCLFMCSRLACLRNRQEFGSFCSQISLH